jgi:hypothetical protein
MKDSHIPQPLLDFLAHIVEFFHLPSLVLDFRIAHFNLKSNLETIVSLLKFPNSSKITSRSKFF